MNVKTAALWIAVVVGLGGVGVAQTTQEFTVKDIVIEGLDQIAPVPVRDQLTFAVGDTITTDAIRATVQNMAAMGVFQKITPDLRQEADGVVVVFELVENPVVRAIEISGNHLYQIGFDLLKLKIPFFWEIIKPDGVIEILKKHEVVPNRIVNINHLRDALQELSKVYQDKGYTLFQIDQPQIENSLQNGQVLRIPIIEYIIEEIRIQGLEAEQEANARALVHLPDDQPATAAQLQQTITALTNSIYFQGVGSNSIEFLPGSKVNHVVLGLNLASRRLIDQPTRIDRIAFSGNTAYSNDRLRTVLENWDKDAPLENIDLLNVLRGVFDLYHKNGYTRMQPQVASLEDGTLNVTIDEGTIEAVRVHLSYDDDYSELVFNPGAPMAVRHVQVDEAGQELEVPNNWGHTQPYVIDKALQMRPGDLYNEDQIRDTVRALLGLEYFDDVQVNLVPNESANRVQLNLSVIEKKKLGSLNGALSLSDNGLVGKLSVSEKNLLGTGQDIAVEYDRGIFGPARTNWAVTYGANGFFPVYKDFNIRVFQSFERPTFDEELSRTGGELTLTYPLTSNLDLTTGGRHENFQKCLRDGDECDAPGVTDAVRFGLSHDTRDKPAFPMEGGRQVVQIEQAGGFSVGTRFTKIDGAISHHFFTLEDQNISVRAFAGWGTGMPSQEKYTFGGPGSIRGLMDTRVDTLAFVNLEYRIKWLEEFTTATFTDWGLSNRHKLLGTVGIEARVAIPLVGMTRLILAWPVNDPDYKTFVPRFQFSFGSMF